MRAFKEWFGENDCKIECNTNCLKCKGSEAGWRAALEWTLKTEEYLTRQDAPIGMREVIEQELGIDDERI